MAADCVQGASNEQRIIALERDIKEVKDNIKELKDDLVKRPSWAVTVIITVLSSATVASLVFALTTLSKSHGF